MIKTLLWAQQDLWGHPGPAVHTYKAPASPAVGVNLAQVPPAEEVCRGAFLQEHSLVSPFEDPSCF